MNSPLQRLANQISHETDSLPPEQLKWHPEGKWSIADILEHLALTYSGTKLVFDRCLQSGKTSARIPSIKDRVRALVVTRLGYLPSGREAPVGTRPKGTQCESIRQEFAYQISLMEASIAECEGRYGRAAKIVDHPILGPFTASEWRRFHCVHGRHHLRQIQRLRKLISSNDYQRT
ncbi:MAG TPA: DinB family protein [Terriglobales bacterium]|nr:DinB family protein [Terriglobales bacterium]